MCCIENPKQANKERGAMGYQNYYQKALKGEDAESRNSKFSRRANKIDL